jgi:hypothetical protein
MTLPFLNTQDHESVSARFLLAGCLLVHGLAAYLVQTDNINRGAFLHTLVQGIADLLLQSSRDGS